MSITSPRRVIKASVLIGTVLGLSALAMPTAASAAETCVPTTTATAQTQPWKTLSESPNKYLDIEAGLANVPTSWLPLLSTVDSDFTQTELDALNTSMSAVLADSGVATQAAGLEIEAQRATFEASLQQVDPGAVPAAEALFDQWNDVAEASPYGSSFQPTFTGALSAVGDYLTAIQQAITNTLPVPVVTSATTDPINALGTGVVGFGTYFGGIFYGGAAAQVVYTQVCTEEATLAATGSNDPTPFVGGAAILLLIGSTVLLVARRRNSTI
ncbi:MAG: LPXTG-motif cell wall anchor protein [Microbacteriaceae bacterium]|nr:LPXTG-motif cell wall anchor protein [Microbacteriaceae bacterium]